MSKQIWSQPEVRSYGEAAVLTQQVIVNKNTGSGDTVNFQLGDGTVVPVDNPTGGSIINSITIDGDRVFP
jgi:hypothetical protein